MAELTAAHDYYADAKIAWRLVRELIAKGQAVGVRNPVTGTLTTPSELSTKARRYVKGQLAEATFQQFISLFENFFVDFLRLWLSAYPRSLGERTVDFMTVLELPDKEAVTRHVVGRELNELLYERPTRWFAYLEEKAKLGVPSADEVDRIAEAKATRDVLVHNRGVANRSYEAKAGRFARSRDGERIDLPEQYHRATWELIRKVLADMSDSALRKLS